MKKQQRVPTPYGPIDVGVVVCDGPQCTMIVLDQYMVGWHLLKPQGMDIATFQTNPDPLDFCSLDCLRASLNLMTGSS